MTTLSDRNTPFPDFSAGVYPMQDFLDKQSSVTIPSTSPDNFRRVAVGQIESAYNDVFNLMKQETAKKPEGIDAVLEQRGNRYGKFTGHAKITQDLKSIMQATSNWSILTPDQKESLEMIMHKVGRILNGDPNYDDSWIDIGGYSKLVADRLTNGKEV